jgi:hypothetical protein
MKRLLLGIGIGALLPLVADNYDLLFMPERLVPPGWVEELQASDPEEPEADEVWLLLPKWRSA